MCCIYLSKLNSTTGCLSSTSKTRIYIVGIGVSNVFMQDVCISQMACLVLMFANAKIAITISKTKKAIVTI